MLLRRMLLTVAMGAFVWTGTQLIAQTGGDGAATAAAAQTGTTAAAGSASATGAPETAAQAASNSSVSAGAQSVRTGGTRVHGTITDPDGELIPGATVTLTPRHGSAVHVTAGSDGTYSVAVSPGVYTMVVSMKGFASYAVSNLKVPSVAAVTVDAKLTLGQTTQVVNVEANSVHVSVDEDQNASSVILTGKALDALSDDPDELQSELEALAGPSAGPNGGQIYVDGFTGGQLPPKSSIREIRINQNPFSAEYDKLGYGRIEIFTKPGTDQFHGSYFMIGNASFLNSGTPPDLQAGVKQPPYHTILMFGNFSGPISKWASFDVGGSHRGIQSDAYTNTFILAQPGSNTPCVPVYDATTGTAGTPAGCVQQQYEASTFEPQSFTNVRPRFDLQLGKNNVLSVRFQYVVNDQNNQGIGNLSLPSQAYNSSTTDEALQMSDTQTLRSNIINETRFEYERSRESETAVSNAPGVDVSGAFNSGGNPVQNTSNHEDHYEVQNYTSIQLKKNFIRLGGRLRATRQAQNLANNTNGTFTYSGLTYSGTGEDNSYETGTPNQYSIVIPHQPDVDFTLADLGLYAETDWKPLPNFTLTYGLRYETQNHLSHDHDWAPRSEFAWGIGRKGTTPKTVVRGGFGLFYDRFSQGSVLTLDEENGTAETFYTLENTTNQTTGQTTQQIPASCTPGATATCLSLAGTSGNGATVYSTAPHLRAPYTIQTAIGVDQQLGHHATVSVNYIHSLGVHALALEDVACDPLNASVISSPCQNVTTFNDQFLSEGEWHEDQLLITPHVQVGSRVTIMAFYALNWAAGDSSGTNSTPAPGETTASTSFLSSPGNFQADYGRPSWDVQSRYQLLGMITLPHLIQLSPFIVAQSGNPYNITEGHDLNGDGVLNDRPWLLPAGTSATEIASLGGKTIAGCGTFVSRFSYPTAPVAGAVVTPINDCTGPAQFTFNVRLTKTWGFGHKGGPKAVNRHGGHNDGSNGSNFGMSSGHQMYRGMFGNSDTAQKYSVTLGVIADNLFGYDNLAAPEGTLTSPNFGRSTQLSGMPYATANALRRIDLQANFNF